MTGLGNSAAARSLASLVSSEKPRLLLVVAGQVIDPASVTLWDQQGQLEMEGGCLLYVLGMRVWQAEVPWV